MPYIIHIPPSYQSGSYLLPPTITTTATHISISASSALARAMYADTTDWGWNTEDLGMREWEGEHGKWKEWEKEGKKRKW